MGDDGDAAGFADQLDRLLGGRPAAGDEGLGARHQVLLEEGAEVAGRPGRAGDVGAADRERVAGLADRVLERQVEALARAASRRSRRPASTRSCCARSQAGAIFQVDPVAADMQVFGVLVHAGHLDRRHQLDPEPLWPPLPPRATPAIASWSVSASVVTPAFAASADDLGGRQLPVGDRRMALQLDQHGAAYWRGRSTGGTRSSARRADRRGTALHPPLNRLRRRVPEGPHSQPRRDRDPGRPHAEGDGHRLGRRLLGDRPRRAARARGRRGLPDRPRGPGRELPQHRQDHRDRQGGGRRRDPSRLRLPRRERRHGPRLRRGRHHLDRAAAGGDRSDGLEDQGARDHGAGRGADRPRLDRGRQGPRRPRASRPRKPATRSPARPPAAAAARASAWR